MQTDKSRERRGKSEEGHRAQVTEMRESRILGEQDRSVQKRGREKRGCEYQSWLQRSQALCSW